MKSKMNPVRGGGASASKKLLAAIAVLAVAFAVFAAIPFEGSDAEATAQGAVSVSEKYSNTLSNSTIGNILWVESDNGTYTIKGYANKISTENNTSIVDEYNATWPTDAPKRGYAIVFSIFSDASSDGNYVHFMSQGEVKTAVASDSFEKYGYGLTVLKYLPESATAGQKITGKFTYTIDNSSDNPTELADPKTINYSVELIDVTVKTGIELLGTATETNKYSVTLDKDYVLSNTMVVPGNGELTLNLNGHKLYANNTAVFTAENKTTVSISGEVDGSSIIAANYPVFINYCTDDSKLTVKGGSYSGLFGLIFYATDGANASCEFDNITVDARDAGLWLSNRAITSGVINNCNITAGSVGIYAGTFTNAAEGKYALTIANTIVNAGNTGVEIKSGDVLIQNSTISSQNYKDDSTEINSNGSGAGVAALTINNGYVGTTEAKSVNVKVEGTTITNDVSSTPVLIIAGKLINTSEAAAAPITFTTNSQTIDQIAVKKADGSQAAVTVNTEGGKSTEEVSEVEELLKKDDVSLVVVGSQTLNLNVPEDKTLMINAANADAKVSGTITTGGAGVQTIVLTNVTGTFSITKGSVQISGGSITAGDIEVKGDTTVVINDVTIAGNVTFSGEGNVVVKAGKTMTIADGAKLFIGPNVTVEVYGKLLNSGAATPSGLIENKGKLVQMSGGVIDGKFTTSTHATLTGNNVSYTESDMKEIKVSGDTEKDLSFSEKQLVTVLDAGLNIYDTVTVAGKLVVPEGAKLTIMAGGELILTNSAELVVEGTLEIEEEDTSVAGSVDGKLTVVKGTVTVSGSIVNNGKIAVGTADYSTTDASADYSTGVLTIAQDGVVTVGENGIITTYTNAPDIRGKVVVDKSATLDVKGLIDGSNIYNAGTVTIDSSAPAASGATICQTADGAVVKVENYTVLASNTNGLKITDAGMVLTTYRDSGETVEVTLPEAQKNTVELVPAVNWTGIDKTEWKATISGLTVVSSVGSSAVETVDEFVNSAAKAAEGKYNNKQYSMTMDVSGTPGVSYMVKDDIVTATAPSTGVSNTGAVTLTQAGTNAKMAVSGELALGDNVTLTVSGKITVTGMLSAGKDAAITNNGTITVSKNGEVTSVNKTVADTIKAVLYETSETVSGSTVKTYHYVTLDAAIVKMNEAGVKNVVLKADQTVSADGKIPAEATLDLGGHKVTVSKDKTLTVASGATVKNGAEIIVKGTLFAEKKTDLKNITKITADVKSEELGEDGNVKKDGWVKYTSLANALAEAKSGETITLTGACELTADTVIPEGVTVVAGENKITLKNGVKLTIDGVLKTDAKIIAQAAFGLTPMNLKVTAPAVSQYASTVVVNGKLMSSTKIVYGYSASSSTEDVANVTLAALSPVAGAYYEQGAYYVISSLAVAQKEIADITSKITVNGAISAGDAAFVGTDDCTEIVIGATVAESATAGAKKIDTVLTVKSLTLSGMKLVFDGTTGYFTGSVAIGDASVSAVHANGFTFYEKDSKVYLGGTVEIADKGDSMTIAAGTVYTDGTLNVSSNSSSSNDWLNYVTVAAGATLAVDGFATVDYITVDGILDVPSAKTFTVDVQMNVNGTVTVAASTGTAAEGTLTVKDLYIGISDSDLTGAAATFNGPVALADDGKILVSSGAAVDDAFADVLNDMKKTAFNVNGSVWFTAYAKNNSTTVEVSKVPVKNVDLVGWNDKDGKKIAPTTTSDGTSWDITIGANEDLYADINTAIYKVVIKADEGIADVYLNGQAMAYGLVSNGNDYYYAYSATVAAGDYKVTYTLKNGWSGTATLYKAGTAQSGNAFSVSGNAGESDFTLSGVEKSGYVEPVTPSEDKDDDGLTITDYLLIVLVVLIVIMAVIVAMRLMRS